MPLRAISIKLNPQTGLEIETDGDGTEQDHKNLMEILKHQNLADALMKLTESGGLPNQTNNARHNVTIETSLEKCIHDYLEERKNGGLAPKLFLIDRYLA